MNTTQEHEKIQHCHVTRRGGRPYSSWRAKLLSVTHLLVVASGWRANTALCYTLTRRGEWMASKHCSLSRIARRGELSTRGGERNRFSVGKYDF